MEQFPAIRQYLLTACFICAALAPGLSCAAEIAVPAETSPTLNLPPTIRVLDADGSPVAGADVTVIAAANAMAAYKFKTTSADGSVAFTKQDYVMSFLRKMPPGPYEVLALARGKAPLRTTIEIPSSGPLEMRFSKDALPAEIILTTNDGSLLPPNVIPSLYPERFAYMANPHSSPESPDPAAQSRWPKPLGGGRFETHFDKATTEPWKLLVHQPGFLRGFEIPFETTTALATGRVEVKLPKPGSVAMKLLIPEQYAESFKTNNTTFTLMRLVSTGKEAQMYWDLGALKPVGNGNELSATLEHLTPGEY